MTPIMSTNIYSPFSIKFVADLTSPNPYIKHRINGTPENRTQREPNTPHTKRVCSIHHTLPYFLLVNTKTIHLIYPDNTHSSLTACKSLKMRLLYQANHLMNYKSSEFLLSSSRTLPETPACH